MPNCSDKQFVVKIHSRSKQLPTPRDRDRARCGSVPHHQGGLYPPHAASEKMAESAAVCRNTRLLKNSRLFAESSKRLFSCRVSGYVRLTPNFADKSSSSAKWHLGQCKQYDPHHQGRKREGKDDGESERGEGTWQSCKWRGMRRGEMQRVPRILLYSFLLGNPSIIARTNTDYAHYSLLGRQPSRTPSQPKVGLLLCGWASLR